jgi:hypothetical protein
MFDACQNSTEKAVVSNRQARTQHVFGGLPCIYSGILERARVVGSLPKRHATLMVTAGPLPAITDIEQHSVLVAST